MIGGVDGYKWNITDSYDNNLNQRNNVNNKDELGQKGAVDKSKTTECQTCKNRKYVDGSNEANVSFKNAAHISPEAASSAVRAHEGQHVSWPRPHPPRGLRRDHRGMAQAAQGRPGRR